MNEIEEKFMITFGIKPNGQRCRDYSCCVCNKYKTCTKGKYPEITDKILLKLICICSSYTQHIIFDDIPCLYEITAKNIEDLKNEILEDCINFAERNIKKDFVIQVQSSFTEGGK